MCSVFDSTTLLTEHNACTLHRKVRSQSLQQVQCDNELLIDTIKAHCSHTIITELLTYDVQPVNQHWHVIYVVMELDRKKDLTWNQITFTSTPIRQFIWVGSRQQLMANVSMTEIVLNGFSIKTSPIVTCLGVEIDAELTFSTHVKQVTARCFYQLRQLWSIRPALTSDSAIMLIHALIASHVVAWITVTVSYSRLLPYISALYSRWWMPQRAWLRRRGSPTALRRLCVTLYIGSWFENEETSNYVFSSTNVSTSLPHRTSSQWSFQFRQCQHIVT